MTSFGDAPQQRWIVPAVPLPVPLPSDSEVLIAFPQSPSAMQVASPGTNWNFAVSKASAHLSFSSGSHPMCPVPSLRVHLSWRTPSHVTISVMFYGGNFCVVPQSARCAHLVAWVALPAPLVQSAQKKSATVSHSSAPPRVHASPVRPSHYP